MLKVIVHQKACVDILKNKTRLNLLGYLIGRSIS